MRYASPLTDSWRCPNLSTCRTIIRKPSRRVSTLVRANFDVGKFTDQAYLDVAAKRYTLGVTKGFKEDELIAMEMGVDSMQDLSDVQRTYALKIKEKLAKRGQEIEREEDAEKERKSRNFVLGKQEYGRGEYPAAVTFLTTAVEDAGKDTALGGEVQLWLALSYQACGRDKEAVRLYKVLEMMHPVRKIQRQAMELRLILEAPVLELGEDERVKIPIIQSDTWRKQERKISYTPKSALGAKLKTTKTKSNYWDRPLDAPSSFLPDQWYLRVAWGVIAVSLTIYLNSSLGAVPKG